MLVEVLFWFCCVLCHVMSVFVVSPRSRWPNLYLLCECTCFNLLVDWWIGPTGFWSGRVLPITYGVYVCACILGVLVSSVPVFQTNREVRGGSPYRILVWKGFTRPPGNECCVTVYFKEVYSLDGFQSTQ